MADQIDRHPKLGEQQISLVLLVSRAKIKLVTPHVLILEYLTAEHYSYSHAPNDPQAQSPEYKPL